MNIAQAKQEIENTVRAYTAKRPDGAYKIPPVHQRPVLLIGPPGIGKTAIMEQIARECHIGLVAYTITHHTRQSAVGLPLIEKKSFQGKEYTITEYTMSEIVASVYTCMEESGKREGILFIDEINCVSETLAPTMLQFLQCKTFGSHKIPEGWVIVAAGNPPQYNKSVREFDIVTLDRVKRIEIEEDYSVWKQYAKDHGIHPYILAYLDLKKENFYKIEASAEGHSFVTARGWEDLSKMLDVYSELKLDVTGQFVYQYLQHPDIANDFTQFYELCGKYTKDYAWMRILCGEASEEEKKASAGRLRKAGFDEKTVVISLFVSGLHSVFAEFVVEKKRTESLFDVLGRLKKVLITCSGEQIFKQLEKEIEERKRALLIKWDSGLCSEEEREREQWLTDWILRYTYDCRKAYTADGDSALKIMKDSFDEEKASFYEKAEEKKEMLDRGVSFLEDAFLYGQETALFMEELSADRAISAFVMENGCPAYERVSKILLTGQKERELKEEIQKFSESMQC